MASNRDCGDALNLRVDFHHISNLMELFGQTGCYDSNSHDSKHDVVLKTVQKLWNVDYQCIEVSNKGELCNNYPSTIMVPLRYMKNSFASPAIIPPMSSGETHDELSPASEDTDLTKFYTDTIYSAPLDDDIANPEAMRKLFHDAMYGRSRKRFVVPTILYKGKYVSRSSTVPLIGEILLRKGQDITKSFPDANEFFGMFNKMVFETFSEAVAAVYDKSKEMLEGKESNGSESQTEMEISTNNIDVNSIKTYIDDALTIGTKATEADVELMKALNIKTIFDLMVEQGKIKYNIPCSSSEKAETGDFYKDFFLNSIPYPGCEFFTNFKTNTREAQNLKFNWSHKEVNAILIIATEELKSIQTNWNYQDWGLVHLTSVYLLMMLSHLKNSEDKDGLSVHCISGWDRTPLFVSLLRISLWADGEIHKSLDAYQMLYFTIAYDWMFFGHNKKNRERKGEEVMLFCFHFLKYIACEHYSVNSDVFGVIKDEKIEEEKFVNVDSSGNVESRPSSRTSQHSFSVKCSTPVPRRADDDDGSQETFRRSISPTEQESDGNLEDNTGSFSCPSTDTSGLGNSICLDVCGDCLKKRDVIEKSDRYRKINELRRAYHATCPSKPAGLGQSLMETSN